jgi:hypothetical protein
MQLGLAHLGVEMGSDAAIARQRATQTALNSIAVCGTLQS